MSGTATAFDLPRGSALAYYPEANVLCGTAVDPRSKTPAFKSVPDLDRGAMRPCWLPQADLRASSRASPRTTRRPWFDANRPLYEAGYVEPGKAFVAELGDRSSRQLSPEVQFEPKVNGSISRINRDIRFSKDKRPYKEHLGLWFWHGDKRGWDQPGFWFRLTAEARSISAPACTRCEKEQLERFRQSIIHPRSGKALLAAVAEVKAKGEYEIGEKTRKLHAPRLRDRPGPGRVPALRGPDRRHRDCRRAPPPRRISPTAASSTSPTPGRSPAGCSPRWRTRCFGCLELAQRCCATDTVPPVVIARFMRAIQRPGTRSPGQAGR